MSEFLSDFVGERVMVVTSMVESTVDMGEEISIPKVLHAELLDLDENFLYLGDQGIAIIMLSLSEVIMIERALDFGEDQEELHELLNNMDGDGTIN